MSWQPPSPRPPLGDRAYRSASCAPCLAVNVGTWISYERPCQAPGVEFPEEDLPMSDRSDKTERHRGCGRRRDGTQPIRGSGSAQ